MQIIVLINNSRTAWPAKILMPLLSFSDNLLQGTYDAIIIIIIILSSVNFGLRCSSL